jgi:SagB-type dehydrogenase family enzyme
MNFNNRQVSGTADRASSLRDYHDRTKHSYQSVRTASGGMDWANIPDKFRTFPSLERIPLPRAAKLSEDGVPAHEAIARRDTEPGREPLDLDSLSAILFLTAGVHRVRRFSGGTFGFRTYASAGALYPIEVYVVAADIPGLSSGVYHYHPLEHSLRRLRDVDARGALAAAAEWPALSSAQAVLALTGIPWRTAWKYGTRGYRHLWWDSGMMLANLLAVAAASDVRTEIVLGFVDRDVDAVLGLDGAREFTLELVALGKGVPGPATAPLPTLELDVEPLSPRELRDPEIEAAHRASSLVTPDEVRAWRAAGIGSSPEQDVSAADVVEVPTLPFEHRSTDPIEEVILRRGSSRRLARAPMPAEELRLLLDQALAGFSADVPSGPLAAFVVANAVTGLEPGSYRNLGDGRFELQVEGDVRREAGFLCLEQRLGADAAAVVFLMADLDAYLGALGGRGYRVAQLQAAVAAGRLYLGAYAQCLGASGITFYDDAVSEFFGAPRWSPMLAVVLGPEGARRSIIRCREERMQSQRIRD